MDWLVATPQAVCSPLTFPALFGNRESISALETRREGRAEELLRLGKLVSVLHTRHEVNDVHINAQVISFLTRLCSEGSEFSQDAYFLVVQTGPWCGCVCVAVCVCGCVCVAVCTRCVVGKQVLEPPLIISYAAGSILQRWR